MSPDFFFGIANNLTEVIMHKNLPLNLAKMPRPLRSRSVLHSRQTHVYPTRDVGDIFVEADVSVGPTRSSWRDRSHRRSGTRSLPTTPHSNHLTFADPLPRLRQPIVRLGDGGGTYDGIADDTAASGGRSRDSLITRATSSIGSAASSQHQTLDTDVPMTDAYSDPSSSPGTTTTAFNSPITRIRDVEYPTREQSTGPETGYAQFCDAFVDDEAVQGGDQSPLSTRGSLKLNVGLEGERLPSNTPRKSCFLLPASPLSPFVAVSREIDELEHEVERMKQSLSSANSAREEYKLLLEEEQEKSARLSRENNDFVKENEMLKRDLEQLRRDLTNANNAAEDRERRREQAQALLDEEKRACATLRRSLDTVQCTLTSTECAYSEMRLDRDKLERRLHVARERLLATEEDHSELTTQFSSVAGELERLLSKVRQVEA